MVLREVVGGFVTGILSLITEVLSFILMATGRERKCLADHIASTIVVRDPDNRLANQANYLGDLEVVAGSRTVGPFRRSFVPSRLRWHLHAGMQRVLTRYSRRGHTGRPQCGA